MQLAPRAAAPCSSPGGPTARLKRVRAVCVYQVLVDSLPYLDKEYDQPAMRGLVDR